MIKFSFIETISPTYDDHFESGNRIRYPTFDLMSQQKKMVVLDKIRIFKGTVVT